MALQTFIAYYRVSTTQQGKSGLGLTAQKEAVERYLVANPGRVLASYTEIESGKRNDRPELVNALATCRLKGCTLMVAKTDRLSRNVEFLLKTVRESGDGGVVFCDMPNIPPGPVGKFMVTQLAAVGELEAGLISARTKAALAVAKANGKVLGGFRGGPVPDAARATEARCRNADAFAAMVQPAIDAARLEGLSLGQIAARLNDQQIRTVRGGSWAPMSVKRVLDRIVSAEKGACNERMSALK